MYNQVCLLLVSLFQRFVSYGQRRYINGCFYYLRDGFKARFRTVSIVLNNDNCPEPDGTIVNRQLGFEVAPYLSLLSLLLF